MRYCFLSDTTVGSVDVCWRLRGVEHGWSPQ